MIREILLLLVDTVWPRCVLCGRRAGYGHQGHRA